MDPNMDALTGEAASTLKHQAAFFEMLAALYYAPLTDEQIEGIDISRLGFDDADYSDLLNEGFAQMKKYLMHRHSGARRELNVDFTGAFYGIKEYQGAHATPCESVFRSDKKILNQEPRHQVFEEYKRYGLKLEDKYNTPDDHLSFELQFLAILARRSADALDRRSWGEAQKSVRSEQAFLEGHVLCWFDDFACLATKLLRTDFYLGILKLTKGFLQLAAGSLADINASLDDLDEVAVDFVN